MYYSRAKAGYYTIDGRNVWCDSQTEATIISRLANSGFSGKWSRPSIGRAYGDNQYTPDLEIEVMWNSATKRVWVELKSRSATEFPKSRRAAARIVLNCNFGDERLLLYVHGTDMWYEVMEDLPLRRIRQPHPAGSGPSPRKNTLSIVKTNRYHRKYKKPIVPTIARVTIDAIESSLQSIFAPPKPRRRRRR